MVIGFQGSSGLGNPQTDLRKLDESIRKTRDAKQQIQLLKTVAGRRDLPGRQWLIRQMAPGHSASYRFAAAQMVFAFEPDTAIQGMLPLWPKAAAEIKRPLGQFLMVSGSAKAVDYLNHHRVDIDAGTVADLLEPLWKGPAPAPKSKAYEAALERFLGEEVRDQEQVMGMKVPMTDGNMNEDPRLCDLAALAMAKRWPKKYQFAYVPSLLEREVQRRKCSKTFLATKQ